MTEHVLSSLDRAHAHRLAGDEEAALRLAIACTKAAPDAPGPIALLARILVDQDRTLIAAEVAARLVDAFIRRGDLPSAVVASTLALDAGEDHRPLLRLIAEAFGKGSRRAGTGTPAPPPFPQVPSLAPTLAQLSGEALFEQAEASLTLYLSSNDPLPPQGPLPLLPLFGALSAAALEQLLSAIRIEEVSGENEVVRQGDLGNEAFVVARGLLNVVRREGGDETMLAQLGPGAIFGEMALISQAPRSASVIALEPVQLLVLEREELERAAHQAPELGAELSAFCHARMRANLVRHARVLSGLAPDDRSRLLTTLESRLFDAGEILIRRDQEADRLYLIASGAVSVSVPEGEDRLVLATLGPGDVVGEISLILRRPASADVTALHPTLTYELTETSLRSLMRTYPSLLVELYDLATRREDEIRAVEHDEALAADDTVFV